MHPQRPLSQDKVSDETSTSQENVKMWKIARKATEAKGKHEQILPGQPQKELTWPIPWF